MINIDPVTMELIGKIATQEAWRMNGATARRAMWCLQWDDLFQAAWLEVLTHYSCSHGKASLGIHIRGLARRGVIDAVRQVTPGKRNKTIRGATHLQSVQNDPNRGPSVFVELIADLFTPRPDENAIFTAEEDLTWRGTPRKNTGRKITCIAEGCERVSHSKNLCGKHYKRRWISKL